MENLDNKAVAEKRAAFIGRLGKKHADKAFENDEEIFSAISDDYDDYDKQLGERDSRIKEYEQNEKTLSDMFTTYPESVIFFESWKRGDNPAMALIRHFGPELVDIINDPDKQEEVAAQMKAHAERVAKERDFEEQYQKNLQESIANIEKMAADGVNEEDLNKAVALLVKISKDGVDGVFTPESINIALDALNHDEDVKNAEIEAEVRGRNAKIEEKLRKSKMGDGTAPLAGKNAGGADNMPRRNLGTLDSYGDAYSDIWERGGEKRTKIN